jgi:TonB family protein
MVAESKSFQCSLLLPENCMRLKIITIAIIACLFTSAHSAPLDNEITTKAILKPSTCGKIAYPKSSLAANETGTVVMSLHVSKEGQILDTRIDASSGHSVLDSATVSGFSQCEFIPARANDVPVDSWTKVKYIWRTE